MPKKVARALPRSRRAKVWTTMARAAGNIRAPPTPWMARNVTIQASAAPPFGVSPHMPEEAANTTTPMTTILVWPTVSASRPPKAKKAASDSR